MLHVLSAVLAFVLGARAPDPPPNLVLIMADDLGYAELGCFGQTRIRTPRLDRMASEGLRMTQFYSSSAVCAPARCSLVTGLHTGHAFVRDNKEVGTEGQLAIPEGTRTLFQSLREQAYATGVFGKWALGGPDTAGVPSRHHVDRFFGYLCQRQAHNFFPTHLWRNDQRVDLAGNTNGNVVGKHYSHDLIFDEALDFVRGHAERPFLLYLPVTIPHVALQVPQDSLAEYAGAFPEEPYEATSGYLPHPTPHAAYAAMVSRLDRDVGRLLDLLDELGLADRTLVIFTSDNGPTHGRVGGADSAFFQSTGGLRGLKGSLHEGGIRVPFIARWPGVIAPGGTSETPGVLYDIMPTFLELAGAPAPPGLDGRSLAPILRATSDAPGRIEREFIYWEFPGYGGQQCVRWGDVKAIREDMHKTDAPIQVYDLGADPFETRDLAGERPDLVERASEFFRLAHVDSPEFPFGAIDAKR